MQLWRHLSFRIAVALTGGLVVTGSVLVSDQSAGKAVENRHHMLRLENEMFRAGVDTREYIRTQQNELLVVVSKDLGRAEAELDHLPPRESAVFRALLEGYRSAWAKTVDAIRARGLGNGDGALGRLNLSAQALDSLVTELGVPKLQVHVLAARQAEKTYILNQEAAAIRRLHASIWSLEEEFRSLRRLQNRKQEIKNASSTYERDFSNLVLRIRDIEDRAKVLAEARLRMARALRGVSRLETVSAERLTRAANIMLLAGSGLAMMFSILLAYNILRPLSAIRFSALRLAEGRTDLELQPGGGAELEAVGEALLAAGLEIQRRTEAQAAAAEAQALARQVLDAHESPFIVLNRDLEVQMMNPAVAELRSQRFEVDVGRSLLDGIPVELREGARQRLQGALSGEITRAKDEVLVDVSGQPRWYASTNVPLRDKDGAIIGVVKSMMDVTRQKLRELELLEAQRKAEAGEAAKGRFLDNVTHEMRTPLNGILGTAELLELESLEPSTRESIELMQASANHLLKMIDSVIEYSEMERQEDAYVAESYCPEELCSGVRRRYLAQASLTNTRIHVKCSIENTLWLPVSPLETVLRELVENAIRYAHGTDIEISAQYVQTPEGQRVRFAVRDDGPGLPVEKRDHIFDAFVLGPDSEVQAEHGLGMGLAKVKCIADRLGADVMVESEPGRGCMVALELLASLARSANQVCGKARTRKPRSDISVLVAEDNPVNQKVALRMLEKLGVSAVVASNGEEAVEAAMRSAFDLVLMDLRMPVLDGLEATRKIRASLTPKDQPMIVALTANNRAADKQACADAGMNGFLSKPVKRSELGGLLDGLTESQA